MGNIREENYIVSKGGHKQKYAQVEENYIVIAQAPTPQNPKPN